MKTRFDFIVVGGGIAGATAACELARYGSVLLLEREAACAVHTTGRSAAISMESYGNALIRQLTCASRAFYESPPPDWTADKLISERGALIVSDEINLGKLRARYQVVREQVSTAQWVDSRSIKQLAPFMSHRWVAGIHEPSAFDLDVHAIHTAFLRGLKQRGGLVSLNAEVAQGRWCGSAWDVELTDGTKLQAGILVNAAGAWADRVAQLCGAAPVGLQPLLRTVVVVDPQCDVRSSPYVGTVDEQIFIKPDVGRLMVSPCDETPSDPCDALPDEMGVAIAMDRLEQATVLRPNRVLNRWAGLRVFVPDRSPVLGWDSEQPGLFWCAALGGYGIQTAPAVGQLVAAWVTHNAAAAGLAEISPSQTSDARLRGCGVRPVVAVAEMH